MKEEEKPRKGIEPGKGSPRAAEHGGVAQLGEHLFCTQGVDSSNLFISTRAAEGARKPEAAERNH